MKKEAEIVFFWLSRSTATGEAVLWVLLLVAVEKGRCKELGRRDARLDSPMGAFSTTRPNRRRVFRVFCSFLLAETASGSEAGVPGSFIG